MPEQKIILTVNNLPIELIEFPQEFLALTLKAAVSSLKKVGEVKELELSFNNGKTTIMVNGDKIPLGPFPANLIAGTFSGLVSAFKGVALPIASYQIKLAQ